MLNKNLYFAVLFKKMYISSLGYNIYIPYRPIIGTIDEKGQIFTESISGVNYINNEQAEGIQFSFGLLLSLKEIKKMFKLIKVKYEDIESLYKGIEENIYYYNEDGILTLILRETFEEETGIYIKHKNTTSQNNFTSMLMDGLIDYKEYNKELYRDYEYIQEEVQQEEITIPINEAYEKIKSRVISQDEQIKKILTAIYKARIFKGRQKKSNIFVFGPTGVGKTEIFRTIKEILNIPLHIEDMTRYTEAGYTGANVEDILKNLYINADEDLEKAQNSILMLDEIDKKATNEKNRSSFNKSDVLKSLLKIVEGGVYEIQINGETILFDTSNLIVVVAGAFSSLYDKKITGKSNIGFERIKEPDKLTTIDDIELKDLKKFGVPSEFIGRFSYYIKMNKLTIEDFIKIMKTSKLSALKEYIEELKTLGVKVNINDNIYKKIAEIAYDYNVGARAINIVVSEIFEEILYELFNGLGLIEEVTLGENITTDYLDYTLKRKKK